MNPKKYSAVTDVWLDGNPVFSLTYEIEPGKYMYNDLLGFRPDPVDYLTPGIKYSATLIFHTEKDHQNRDRWVLRYVDVEPTSSGRDVFHTTQRFAYIR
jgi:hypothetical protein